MVEKEELFSIVPHRGRMLLLSRIKGFNPEEGSIEAEYHITEDCLFYDSAIAGVPAWVGFELIAQAISAISGLRDHNKGRPKGKPPKIGFILSVSHVKIELPFFYTGSIIRIKAKEIDHMDLVYTFEGEIILEDKTVLKGQLTVMDVDDGQAEALLKEQKYVG
jgi:predicted hotdog family 3-hydroxylacyl-ACP dehydratase